jgi:hypothetical protein
MSEVVLAPVAAPTATLVQAIASVMTEVHVVAKRGENEFHRYRYATMGDILQEITPLLGRHGIVIFQSETGRAMFDDDNVIAVEYSFTVAHASGETWPHVIKQTGVSACRNSKGGWDDKSLNKCHTAARKYFLLALFQIPTGDEADADQGETDERPAKQIVRTVVEAPKHRLKPGSIADRAITKRNEQAFRSVGGPSQPFLASEAGRFNERNPPPHDAIPDAARDAAKALNRKLHPLNDGIPDFLDRRKPADEPASYLDLVAGGAS